MPCNEVISERELELDNQRERQPEIQNELMKRGMSTSYANRTKTTEQKIKDIQYPQTKGRLFKTDITNKKYESFTYIIKIKENAIKK